MNENILILDAGNTLPLASLQALYSCKRVAPEELTAENTTQLVSACSVAVIATQTEASALELGMKLRACNAALPILFVTDHNAPATTLLRVQGHGPVRMLYIHADDDDQLLRDVQSLLHPEYPVANGRIAVMLPVYNEESRFQNVRNFTHKLRHELGSAYPNLTIFFVNDGSKDRTQELVDQIIADDAEQTEQIPSHLPVTAHVMAMNSRKAGTYIQGMLSMRADVLIFADADDSFSIEDIASMINIVQDGYWDMVIGTKDQTAEDRKPIRRAMSFVKRVLTRPLLPPGVVDSQTGLKAMRGVAARHILPYLHTNTGLAIDLEMVHLARRLNFRVLQLPVFCIDRDGSHVDVVRDGIRFLKSIATIWANNRQVSAPLATSLLPTSSTKSGDSHVVSH